MYRFTDNIVFSFLVFSCSTACLFIAYENPPNRPAKMSCHGNMPDPPASMTRQIYLPEIPPSPLKIPRQNTARQPPPPPHGSANGAGGRGRRADPARLCILNRYFYFLMNDYISL